MAFKSGIVSIIGRPNVGKSTLINALAGQKVSIISNKPQTTRNSIRAIITKESYQIVFIDTPGIHKPKNKLGELMINSVNDTLEGIDAVIVMIEPHIRERKMDEYIIKLVGNSTPVILAINKIDTKSRGELLPVIEYYRNLVEFKAVIPISAFNNDGVSLILDEILQILPEGPKYYPEEYITDRPEKFMAAEIIREKLLYLLNEEIPHGIGVSIIKFAERKEGGIIDIEADIYCERDSHKSIIIGKKGSVLKRVGELARIDIENMVQSKVFLSLWVKVKKGWRDSNTVLKVLGYNLEI